MTTEVFFSKSRGSTESLLREARALRTRARRSGSSAAYWYLLWSKAVSGAYNARKAVRLGLPTGFTPERVHRLYFWAMRRHWRATRRLQEEEYARENAL